MESVALDAARRAVVAVADAGETTARQRREDAPWQRWEDEGARSGVPATLLLCGRNTVFPMFDHHAAHLDFDGYNADHLLRLRNNRGRCSTTDRFNRIDNHDYTESDDRFILPMGLYLRSRGFSEPAI